MKLNCMSYHAFANYLVILVHLSFSAEGKGVRSAEDAGYLGCSHCIGFDETNLLAESREMDYITRLVPFQA